MKYIRFNNNILNIRIILPIRKQRSAANGQHDAQAVRAEKVDQGMDFISVPFIILDDRSFCIYRNGIS